MTRLAFILLCLVVSGCACAPKDQRPVIHEATDRDCPAQVEPVRERKPERPKNQWQVGPRKLKAKYA